MKNLAEVTVNGKPLGVAWHGPYRMDVTRALKPGANALGWPPPVRPQPRQCAFRVKHTEFSVRILDV